MWGRIFNLVLKEFLQLRRDRQAKFRLIVPPLIQMIIFGYAATFRSVPRVDCGARSRP